MRVLAVSAHPDDVELLCAGTLLRFANAGDETTICHVTTGNKGSYDIPPDELANIRIKEARAAAALAGAKHSTLGYGDGEVNAGNVEQRDAVVRLLREVRPDLIITHYPADYQVDHNEVACLVFDASFYASVPSYLPGKLEATAVTPIHYMEPIGGYEFDPTEWVDITDVMDRKIEMLRQHSSQLTWLSDHDGDDPVERMITTSRFRGLQAGVQYAEAFRQCTRWMRPQPRRLLP